MLNTAEVREAEHALQHLGWTELFAYLCPGAIMLLSPALWITSDFAAKAGELLPHNEFISAILFLLLSYAIGLPVAQAAEAATNRYVTARLKRRAFQRSSRSVRRRLTRNWLAWGAVAWIPEWPRSQHFVRQSLRLQDDIENLGLPRLSITVNRWANLAIYRALIAERLGYPAVLVLREAETVHRRRLFAIGAASAMMLVAFQAGARMIFVRLFAEGAATLFGSCPTLSYTSLTAILLVSGALSITLRYVAGRFWEIEFLLTCSNPLNPGLNKAEHPVAEPSWRSIVSGALKAMHRR